MNVPFDPLPSLYLNGMDQKRDIKQKSINFTDVAKANETWLEAWTAERDKHKSMSSQCFED